MFNQVNNQAYSRRNVLKGIGLGIGGIAFSDLMSSESGAAFQPRFPAKAKRVIQLFMSGGPSQLDLLDPKPLLNQRQGEQLPDSVRQGQRLTGMSANQASIPIAGSPFKFAQHGECGAWFSELLPHTAAMADDLCIVRSMYTDSINHGPGVSFLQTGSQLSGRPSFGSWLDYGLGRMNEDLPGYVVLLTKNKGGQPLASRLWGNAFLPGRIKV